MHGSNAKYTSLVPKRPKNVNTLVFHPDKENEKRMPIMWNEVLFKDTE